MKEIANLKDKIKSQREIVEALEIEYKDVRFKFNQQNDILVALLNEYNANRHTLKLQLDNEAYSVFKDQLRDAGIDVLNYTDDDKYAWFKEYQEKGCKESYFRALKKRLREA